MRCAVPVAAIRREPDESAEQVTQALLREPLTIDEERDGWARVVTVYGYPGWVKLDALEEGEGELSTPVGTDPLTIARGYLGAPYEWGGLTENGIDCSGLVHIAYRAAGRIVPRDAWQQEAAGAPVPPGDARPGDLVTYGDRERADHVAFVAGAATILHATARNGLGVVEEAEPEELAARRRRVVRLPPFGLPNEGYV
jgi:cell wall-associated NlpC family hydrolase